MKLFILLRNQNWWVPVINFTKVLTSLCSMRQINFTRRSRCVFLQVKTVLFKLLFKYVITKVCLQLLTRILIKCNSITTCHPNKYSPQKLAYTIQIPVLLNLPIGSSCYPTICSTIELTNWTWSTIKLRIWVMNVKLEYYCCNACDVVHLTGNFWLAEYIQLLRGDCELEQLLCAIL